MSTRKSTEPRISPWPKYDPRTGFWLCESCWNNGRNWKHRCSWGMCECPKCSGMQPPEKVKFTGEGQTSISMENPLEIRKDS